MSPHRPVSSNGNDGLVHETSAARSNMVLATMSIESGHRNDTIMPSHSNFLHHNQQQQQPPPPTLASNNTATTNNGTTGGGAMTVVSTGAITNCNYATFAASQQQQQQQSVPFSSTSSASSSSSASSIASVTSSSSTASSKLLVLHPNQLNDNYITSKFVARINKVIAIVLCLFSFSLTLKQMNQMVWGTLFCWQRNKWKRANIICWPIMPTRN